MRGQSEAGVIVPRSPLSGAAQRPARRRTGLARLIGGLGMVALATTLLWLLTDDSFRVTAADVRVEGVRFGDEAAIRAQIRGLDRVPNVFRVRASEFVAEMRALPEVSSASAVVTLPAAVSVRITEREPLFRWTDGKQTWLVDGSGVLFAQVPTSADAASSDAASSDAAGTQAAAGGQHRLRRAGRPSRPAGARVRGARRERARRPGRRQFGGADRRRLGPARLARGRGLSAAGRAHERRIAVARHRPRGDAATAGADA